jgi:copper(I)-binding protein
MLTRALGTPMRPWPVLAAAVVGLGVLAGCGGSHSASQPSFATGSATAGDLHISGAYVPLNASPGVAAAYFTVTDDGAADTLVSVSSPVSREVGMHRTVESGTTGEMVPVASLPVSQAAALRLQPGGYHLMLMNPTPLTVGERVALTLHFAKAGAITVETPVVPLTATDGDSSSMGMS